LLALFLSGMVGPSTARAEGPPDLDFKSGIQPFLGRYCSRCHSAERTEGGINLEMFSTELGFHQHRDRAMEVVEALEHDVMPPEDAPRHPPADMSGEVASWIRWRLDHFDPDQFKHPGYVPSHRLTRTQYRNTIRDLIGTGMEVADDLPTDEASHGFDSTAETQDMSPAHFERYLEAAGYVLDRALPGESQAAAYEAEDLPYVLQFGKDGGDEQVDFPDEAPKSEVVAREHRIYHTGGIALSHEFPQTGLYEFRLRLWGAKAQDVKRGPEMELKIDAHTVGGIHIPTGGPERVENPSRRVVVRGGMRDIKFDMKGMGVNPQATDPLKRFNMVAIDSLEIIGPLRESEEKATEIRKRLLPLEPGTDLAPREAARRSLEIFTPRAFRRPVSAVEIDRLLQFYDLAREREGSFEDAMKLALKAVLASPNFLMHIEHEEESGEAYRLTPHELANRLSYFLWSSMPDEDLTAAALDGSLLKPEVLEAQTRRMLGDPKARSLAENFAPQWLALGSLFAVHRDGILHPNNLRERRYLLNEVVGFFDHLVREDRPILELIDSDYLIVNEWLAGHYGIAGVSGEEFRKVGLKGAEAEMRGGVLGMAGVHLSISHPRDTNPSGRGKWVLDALLGTPPPPPPPNIPELPKGGGEEKMTLRERMTRHRADPSCAGCHRKIDPIGFALENYDPNGVWRDQENGKPLDVSAEMPGGAKIEGPAGLRNFLVREKRDAFERNFAKRLLTYGLRRGLEFYDEGAIREVLHALEENDGRFSAAVVAIVKSHPFQYRQDPATLQADTGRPTVDPEEPPSTPEAP
jgi:hypothetical protein